MRGDPVRQPAHYREGGLETIDVLRAKSTPSGFAEFCRLTALQYLIRAGRKVERGETADAAMLRDMEKALSYVGWGATALRSKKRKRPKDKRRR